MDQIFLLRKNKILLIILVLRLLFTTLLLTNFKMYVMRKRNSMDAG